MFDAVLGIKIFWIVFRISSRVAFGVYFLWCFMRGVLQAVVEAVKQLNADDTVDGILVQVTCDA